jgi:hypothetical protein
LAQSIVTGKSIIFISVLITNPYKATYGVAKKDEWGVMKVVDV